MLSSAAILLLLNQLKAQQDKMRYDQRKLNRHHQSQRINRKRKRLKL